MKDRGVIQKAGEFAQKAHDGQSRKFTGEPYFTHPNAVASLVWRTTGNPGATAAAFLHDTIEDTDVTFDDLIVEFGITIAGYVNALTKNTDKSIDKNLREKQYNAHLVQTLPIVKTIKLADICDNLKNINEVDREFAEGFVRAKKHQLQFLTEGDEGLYNKALSMIQEFENE